MYARSVESLDIIQPAHREPAPPALRGLQAFVNTNDIEEERDALATPDQLRDWLTAAGALPVGAAVTAREHARAIAVREGLRALGCVNNGEPLEEERIHAMNAAAAELPLVASVSTADAWSLTPARTGIDGFLAGMIGTLVGAIADGSWSRMKACRNDGCRWLFYDHSRNRSGTWCTMAICGSRMKARAYRARHREGSEAATA
jgi:predicted RNA-binding Zn ribbon-like protein